MPNGATAAPPRINGAVGTPDALPPEQIAYGRQDQPSPEPSATEAGPGNISLDFADTDIREVAAQILGSILKVNYTIDPAVHGTATLHTTRPLNRSELVPTLESLLAQNGAALVTNGGLYRVVPFAQAIATAASSAGTAGAVVVPLQYATAENLAKILQPYVGEGGKIAADPARNALLISGEPGAREGLIGLVRAFDVDVLAGQSYALLPVGNGDVKDFASALQDAFRGQNGGTLAGLIRVIPLSRINAVLIVSSQQRYIDEARRVYSLIDRARRQTLRSWHVYYLQNSHSDDVAYVLQQAFTPGNVTAQPTANTRSQTGQSTGGSDLRKSWRRRGSRQRFSRFARAVWPLRRDQRCKFGGFGRPTANHRLGAALRATATAASRAGREPAAGRIGAGWLRAGNRCVTCNTG